MTTFVSKETIHRLLKDVKQIIKQPLTEQGIYYIHHETDMLKGYAMIVGPADTPYFGGYYFFELTYPADYPHSPPKVKYYTNGGGIRFNPNLYTSGKVCVSLLNTWSGDQWTSCQSISTVLLTLCTLLCKDPLLNEPGVKRNHPDMLNYTSIIEYANLSVAVCDVVQQKEGVYQPFFELFQTAVKEHFMTNYDTFAAFSQQKAEAECAVVHITFYSMSVYLNYEHVCVRLNQCKALLDVDPSVQNNITK